MTGQTTAATRRPASQRAAEQQSIQIAECFFELIGTIVAKADKLAQRLSVPVPFIKALHTLECPMAMKELGKRMHCDPSFVTLVADMLEKRGLARREPHPADRRVKNLVLTDDGVALKHRIETEITAEMPWNQALDPDERTQLLALIRKMLAASRGPDGPESGVDPAGPFASLLASALKDAAMPPASTKNPPSAPGEVTGA